jgi:hypothetical protein
VNLEVTVVVNETQLPELIHEETDAWSGCSDHLRECLLIDGSNDRLRLPLLAEIRQEKEGARQPASPPTISFTLVNIGQPATALADTLTLGIAGSEHAASRKILPRLRA